MTRDEEMLRAPDEERDEVRRGLVADLHRVAAAIAEAAQAPRP